MHANWREMVLVVFRGEDSGGIVWQPRIEFWFDVNKRRGTLPTRYADASYQDLYADLGASRRYFVSPLRVSYDSVNVSLEMDGDRRITVWKTPVGSLREIHRTTSDGHSGYNEKYRVRTPEDLRIQS